MHAAVRFVNDFVAAWEGRATDLIHAVDHQDLEGTSTVLLSIRATSAMIGATVLSSKADELLGQLAGNRRIDAHSAEGLVAVGAPTCRELKDLAQRLESAAA